MVHVVFNVNSVNFDNFFSQTGQIGAGYSFFEGVPYQRGYGVVQQGKGLGNVLAGLWRFISPALRSLGVDLGKETLSTGGRVLSDLAVGEPLKSSVRQNIRSGARNVLSKQSNKYLTSPQTGSGKRRMIGRAFSKDVVSVLPPIADPTVTKKKRKRGGDVFD